MHTEKGIVIFFSFSVFALQSHTNKKYVLIQKKRKMIATPYSRIVAGAITLVATTLQLGMIRAVSAQINNDSWCANSRFDNLDATASYSVPGFAYPENNNNASSSSSFSNNNSTWTFSTGAVNYINDYKIPVQRIWVDTSPVVQLDSDSLPYRGCVLLLLSLTNKVAVGRKQDKNGDCKSILGEECVSSILANVNTIAQGIPARTEKDFRQFNQSDSLNYSFEYSQCRSYFVGAAFPQVCGPVDDLYVGVGELYEKKIPIRQISAIVILTLIFSKGPSLVAIPEFGSTRPSRQKALWANFPLVPTWETAPRHPLH